MGQRTQIVVIEKKPKGEVDKRFYHIQWGYGKVMYNGMMSLCQTLLNGCSPYEKGCYALLKDLEFKNFDGYLNLTEDYANDEEAKNVDIDNIESVKALFDTFDNNNGGLVIEVKWTGEEYRYNVESIRAGFLLGNEGANERDDEIKFQKFVSPLRYRQTNGYKFFSDDFYDAFKLLTKCAGVKWIVEDEETLKQAI